MESELYDHMTSSQDHRTPCIHSEQLWRISWRISPEILIKSRLFCKVAAGVPRWYSRLCELPGIICFEIWYTCRSPSGLLVISILSRHVCYGQSQTVLGKRGSLGNEGKSAKRTAKDAKLQGKKHCVHLENTIWRDALRNEKHC